MAAHAAGGTGVRLPAQVEVPDACSAACAQGEQPRSSRENVTLTSLPVR